MKTVDADAVLNFLTGPDRDKRIAILDGVLESARGQPVDVGKLLTAVDWYSQHHDVSESVRLISEALRAQN
jgi:hypothetical protein